MIFFVFGRSPGQLARPRNCGKKQESQGTRRLSLYRQEVTPFQGEVDRGCCTA
jgi:hypothetical protein